MNYPLPDISLTKPLNELKPGESGWVSEINTTPPVARRLRELGVIEGASVKLMHEAPFGGDPLAIQVRGGKLALRRAEAKLISIQRVASL